MFGKILPKHYTSQELWEQEVDSIFESSWNFLGTVFDFPEVGSFRTAKIGQTEILVTRSDSGFKAFRNACTHRWSPLVNSEKGNCKSFKCPYHGWCFNLEGKLLVVPGVDVFPNMESCREQLDLDPVDLSLCGTLLFARLSRDGSSLQEYLGDFFKRIEEQTLRFVEQTSIQKIQSSANWKLILENGIEDYHAPWIHPGTLGSEGMTPPSAIKYSFCGKHSLMEITPWKDWSRDYLKTLDKMFPQRPHRDDNYFVYFLFPNLLISSDFGIYFSVVQFLPAGPESTLILVRTFLPELGAAVTRAHKSEAALSHTRVIEEDRVISELVQKNMMTVNRPIFSGKYEERLGQFHKVYLQDMAGNKRDQSIEDLFSRIEPIEIARPWTDEKSL